MPGVCPRRERANLQRVMVITGTKHALQCGGLTHSWREWRCLPAIQHMWLNWKNHWTAAAFNKQQDISRLTGGTVMSEANASVDNAQGSSQMITSLDNLANAAVQKNDTVERLVVANKQLMDTITKLQEDNAKLLNIMQQMAGNHPRLTPTGTATPTATSISGTQQQNLQIKKNWASRQGHSTAYNGRQPGQQGLETQMTVHSSRDKKYRKRL
ncbi:hypothetical protein ACHAW6_012695 [Cyclotella cf. meneghiniana]